CAHVRELTSEFVRSHYSVKEFNEEISRRAYERFFQTLDPGKTYFLQEDYDSFKPLDKTMYQKIRSIDCRFITDINNLFSKRVKETEDYVTAALAKPFNFSVDEFIETDRKKVTWAKNKDELK